MYGSGGEAHRCLPRELPARVRKTAWRIGYEGFSQTVSRCLADDLLPERFGLR